LVTGQSKDWLSWTGFAFLAEILEESVFCQADINAITESAVHVELILLIAVFLLLSFPCALGKE